MPIHLTSSLGSCREREKERLDKGRDDGVIKRRIYARVQEKGREREIHKKKVRAAKKCKPDTRCEVSG